MALSVKIAPRVAPGFEPVLQFASVFQAWLEVLIQVVSVGTAAKVSEPLTVNREAVRSRGFFTNERGLVTEYLVASCWANGLPELACQGQVDFWRNL